MELSKVNHAGSARAQKIIDTFGCLPSCNPLTTLDEFKALELAQAIEQNINEAMVYGNTKITVHFDLPDAARFAQFLRAKG